MSPNFQSLDPGPAQPSSGVIIDRDSLVYRSASGLELVTFGKGHSRRYRHVRSLDTGHYHVRPRPVFSSPSCARSANDGHSQRSSCVPASLERHRSRCDVRGERSHSVAPRRLRPFCGFATRATLAPWLALRNRDDSAQLCPARHPMISTTMHVRRHVGLAGQCGTIRAPGP
jgi:hypothetical protein